MIKNTRQSNHWCYVQKHINIISEAVGPTQNCSCVYEIYLQWTIQSAKVQKTKEETVYSGMDNTFTVNVNRNLHCCINYFYCMCIQYICQSLAIGHLKCIDDFSHLRVRQMTNIFCSEYWFTGN